MSEQHSYLLSGASILLLKEGLTSSFSAFPSKVTGLDTENLRISWYGNEVSVKCQTRIHRNRDTCFFLSLPRSKVPWTVKKAERQRIDAFELWCWRRLLRVPWTARRSNQSILKEISPGCSLEGLVLKLKLHTLPT